MKTALLTIIGLALFGRGSALALAQADHPAPPAATTAAGGQAAGETTAAGHAATAPGARRAHYDTAARDASSHAGGSHAGGAHDAGPVPPGAPQRWPGVTVFVILLMFFMAAVIGPIVRAQAPPEMPATHSHDEPPGASHHHGHGGTINPVPEDVAKLEQGHGHGHHH